MTAPVGSGRPGGYLRGRLPVLAGLVALPALVALAAFSGTAVTERRATEALVRLSAVVALYIFAGNSGVLSFGNVSFMAIAAYTSALLTLSPQAKGVFLPDLPGLLAGVSLDPVTGALAGAALAAAVALVIGVPLMRLSGIQASIATFAVLSITTVVIGNWNSVTGGQQSLMGLRLYTGLPVALALAVATILAAFLHEETRSALLLRAAREDPVAARATGIDVNRHRLIAFVLSAFFSGLAGVLYGHFVGALRAEMFYLDLTFITVAMLVIGGMRSLAGAVVGALAISGLGELFRLAESGVALGAATWAAPAGLGDAVLGLLMVLFIRFAPDGLAGALRRLGARETGR